MAFLVYPAENQPEEKPKGRFIVFPRVGSSPPSETETKPAQPTEPTGKLSDLPTMVEHPGKDIVLPFAENAASLFTAGYGVPLSGFAGLASLPWGLKTAKRNEEAVSKALVYRPQTTLGKGLQSLINKPLEWLSWLAGKAAEPAEEAGYPNLAASINTAVQGAPYVLMGGHAVLKGEPTIADIDKKIDKAASEGIEKGIRPSVKGTRFYSQYAGATRSAIEAVKEIVRNRGRLELTDENGEPYYGLPQNLKQLTQAVDQVKKTIFEQYNALTKEAGKKGASVDLHPIAKELRVVAEDKKVNTFRPAIANYCSELAQRMDDTGSLTPEEAEDSIALYNRGLQAFDRNPDYQSESRAWVDNMVRNHLRKGLDSIIEDATGEQYGPLKRKYGALKSIERDAIRRSIVNARANKQGLASFTDVFSGYEVIRGILQTEPSVVAAGLGSRFIRSVYQMWNNPDRIIRKMFERVGKLENSKPSVPSVPGPELKAENLNWWGKEKEPEPYRYEPPAEESSPARPLVNLQDYVNKQTRTEPDVSRMIREMKKPSSRKVADPLSAINEFRASKGLPPITTEDLFHGPR